MATATRTRGTRKRTTGRKAAAPARKAKTPAKTPAKSGMTDAHKRALAVGREQGRAVDAYLELVRHSPKRGPRRTPERLDKLIADLTETAASATGATRLRMVQRRIDLEAERDALLVQGDTEKVKAAFVKHAAGYGLRKGITYGAWRECGVPAVVLAEAGITRSGS